MRIQDTDRILKEARIARHHNAAVEPEHGMMSRAWSMVTHLPGRITSLFSRKH
ncbi:MAG: hypothetical protein WA208_02005 [Thermoanaerobaculia bacterium]